ncbi:dynamin family protein [Gordonia rubripertincta]|uniref:Dynamin family protein n=1 Tax=Gordonia rubripertincta TaxID=36822 RepID=A0AAW4G8M1_GORRU|nr:dynamin family protein [Gordonia rubripertincta]MBM7279633.1 dynamin family protein [Gordonia rubripertincta]
MAGIDRARSLLDAARGVLADDPRAQGELDLCEHRMYQPVRVALAGSLKAGKSTLLNALVGQDIAPTDATECTRVVTWYRSGRSPSVTAHVDDGRAVPIPVTRVDGRLGFDFGHLTADRVDHLDVEWPSRALQSTTIVDTPGTASLSTELSDSTIRLLAPRADEHRGQSGVDAVVYLLRSLTATDTAMLRRIGTAIGGSSGPLGVIGVVSRADELGAGRMDAMISAQQIAGRFAGELERTGLCQAVVPVAGLLALAARTLREVEFRALAHLASTPGPELESALLTVDRFARPDILPHIPAALRRSLAERFGVFGIRLAVTLVRFGATSSTALAAELLERSGLPELSAIIDTQFAQRADELKSHSALVTLDHLLAACASTRAADLRVSVRRELADVHGFRELRVLTTIRGGGLDLPPDQIADLSRLIGGSGIDPATRLGLPAETDAPTVRSTAIEAARTWRSLADHPLIAPDVASACQVAVRSAEGIVARLDEPQEVAGTTGFSAGLHSPRG